MIRWCVKMVEHVSVVSAHALIFMKESSVIVLHVSFKLNILIYLLIPFIETYCTFPFQVHTLVKTMEPATMVYACALPNIVEFSVRLTFLPHLHQVLPHLLQLLHWYPLPASVLCLPQHLQMEVNH